MANGNSFDKWQQARDRVSAAFGKLASAERAQNALELLDYWMKDPLFEPQWPGVLAHIEAERYPLLLESFYQFIPFGTGGRRGRVGFGPNRISEATVALSVQGHCNYLIERMSGEKTVVIACDVRIFKDICGTYDFLDDNPMLDLSSRILAGIAAEIYAGNGVMCFFVKPGEPKGYLSTPELSFLIRHLGALGGINVSASHNHPDDNGYKFFNTDGAQDVPPHDEELADFMNGPGAIKRMPFADGVAGGLIRGISPEGHTAYLESSLELRRGTLPVLGKQAPPIVYTPLSGTGLTTVAEVLRAAGHNLVLHEPQATFDGTFHTIPFRLPNPEVPQAPWPATETADACGASIVISTDPDADRLGLIAKGADGRWVHLNGNEIASILAYYLVIDAERGPRRKGIVITTAVTTGMIERIARNGGCSIVSDLLVGFKYIAHVLHGLEFDGRYHDVDGRAEDLILACEESHGFLLTPKIRDKDAAGAALVLADLVVKLAAEGKTILDYVDEVAANSGNFGNDIRSVLMSGMKGSDQMKALMLSLRADPPKRVGDRDVVEFRDFLGERPIGQTPGWPDVEIVSSEDKSSNLLMFRFDGARTIIRPSGTEPKVKVYAEAEAPGASRAEAKARAYGLATEMYGVCLERLGYSLSKAAGRIPDHVETDLKQAFDKTFTPAFLGRASELAASDAATILGWLRENLKAYGGGSDPLAVMKPALKVLCGAPSGKAKAGDLGIIAKALD
ncbi:MAG TPA: hypothetical protein PLO37_16935 [Candidatus Hydrogenedentes bacterium]|nr:hypothetical protein [Candidatus Hydrogenedentota bacterium]HPG68533.1 hypothetical protein [Candidatus Hydrogenedentota bacterium]